MSSPSAREPPSGRSSSDPFPPRGLEETPAAVDTPVVQRTIDDRRSIRLALELGPSASLKSPSDGLITESACQAGQAIASGDHMMTLGDQRLYALATAIPLWRDLGPGDQGDDVTALQAELQRLGYLVDADGRIGPQTLRSVADLVGLSGTPRVLLLRADPPGLLRLAP